MRRAYGRAVWQGEASTQLTAEQERGHGALELLTMAFQRLPDLALFAHLAHACELDLEDDADRAPRAGVFVLDQVSAHASGALRLTHRALESHGRLLDYAIDAWVGRAIDRARRQLDVGAPIGEEDLAIGVALEQARLATIALTRAAAATERDPLLVADRISDALGHLLALCLIAREAGGST